MTRSQRTLKYRALRGFLIERRNSADLTQRDLALLLGVPQSFVAKIENGERRVDFVELLLIANALGSEDDLPKFLADLVAVVKKADATPD